MLVRDVRSKQQSGACLSLLEEGTLTVNKAPPYLPAKSSESLPSIYKEGLCREAGHSTNASNTASWKTFQHQDEMEQRQN